MYATISNYCFKFLDITNFLTVGTSYSKFLNAYDIDVGKSFFPYEWFDCAEKLDFQHLPAYEDFYSNLKNKNTLEISDKKSKEETEKISAKEVGEENYKHLQHVWKEQNMTSFRDFLVYYNNLDVAPFIKAVEKMQDFYFEKDIDLFKIAISVPGIARNWLFNIARDKNIAFALIHQDDSDLYYTIKANLTGGPSIIFKRDAEVDRTHIKDDSDKICKAILGLDANALYLFTMSLDMPTGAYIRRFAPDFKPVPRTKYENQFHWLDYLMKTEGIKIQHARNSASEFRIGPYFVDGYDEENGTVYEYQGCFVHGCKQCGLNKTPYGRKKHEYTESRNKYLATQTRYVKKIVIMWSHEFQAKLKYGSNTFDGLLHDFVRSRTPQFFRTHKYKKVTEHQILSAVKENKLFGFIECDIHTPDELYDHFKEMPPLFVNTEVEFKDIGELMQNYAKEADLHTRPRRLLVSGMKAEKILLSSPYLKWLMEHGLVVTKVYQVVEYVPVKCFKKFVDEVTQARRTGDSDIRKALIGEIMKLIGNSAYDSLIMDKKACGS